MLSAILAVENIISNIKSKDNLWELNTEQQYHEQKLTSVENLVDAYIEDGHEVVVIDNLSTGNKDNLNPKATFYKIDIRENLQNIFEKHNFDIVNYACQNHLWSYCWT